MQFFFKPSLFIEGIGSEEKLKLFLNTSQIQVKFLITKLKNFGNILFFFGNEVSKSCV